MQKTIFYFFRCALFIFLTFICVKGFAQDKPVKWSVNVANSFIARFPDPDTMYCCGNTNHFSWQAGYVMFAMEKIWKATGDPVYYNYIKRFLKFHSVKVFE